MDMNPLVVNPVVVELSRWQFAATALYHFLFVPLTLGLGFLIAAMETVYVTTGRVIYRDMARFWGRLFAINFALGVATGITMEFEFGTNWSLYSYFVGDIFGAPLAVEGLMAFFLESTFVGLMFFGWERMGRGMHLVVTYMVAIGSALSALWILIANSFMQNPVGARLNPLTMRLDLKSFSALFFNPDAQAKFVHTIIAGYVTASMFVVGVSCYYLLRNRHTAIAKRSIRVAALFGVFATVGVITLGDALGLIDRTAQAPKLDAMEALWRTAKAPAPFHLIAFPDQKLQRNFYTVNIPDLLTPLVTRTMTDVVPGIDRLIAVNRTKIRDGIPAVVALRELARNPHDKAALATFKAHEKDIGYGLLLERYAPNVARATPAQIEQAARDTIPEVWIVFWAFRIMVALAFLMLAFFVLMVLSSLRGTLARKRWLLRSGLWLIPAPFIACEMGWLVSEVGRQPWTVYRILPTFLSASAHSVGYMVFSLSGFVLFYSTFIVIEMFLMVKYIRLGPDTPAPGESREGQVPPPVPAAP